MPSPIAAGSDLCREAEASRRPQQSLELVAYTCAGVQFVSDAHAHIPQA